MVKSLGDLCLRCIEEHLSSIPFLGSRLPTMYKERLIERLAFHDRLQKSVLPAVSYNLFSPALTHINLYRCSQVDDAFLISLAECKCQLEVLVINGCASVSDTGMQAILSGQEKLCVLELKRLTKFTSRGLSFVRSPVLWKVKIKQCNQVLADGVQQLVINNQSIKVLIVLQCPAIDPQSFTYSVVAKALGPCLEELELSITCAIENDIVSLADHCPNLRRLNLSGAKGMGKESFIKLFQGLTRLQSLDLSYCSRLAHGQECQALWTLPQSLKELSLCGIQLRDEQVFVEGIHRLRCLTSLRLCGVLALTDSTLSQILERIGPNLELLDISGGIATSVTDEGLCSITRHCHNLQELCLSLLTKVTCVTLLPIFHDQDRASKIHKLYLSCKQLDPTVMSVVALTCHELRLLELSGVTSVTDEVLFQLAENCPKLTHLAVKGCLQLTDSSVCEVVRRCPIESLVVSGIHNLTDKCIFVLANTRPELKELFLNGCSQITPAAVRYLCDCCIGRLFVCHVIPNAQPNQMMAKNLDTGEFCRADLMLSHNFL